MFGTLKRFLKLYLCKADQMEKFLKINAFKYKFEEVREFVEVKGPLDLKLEKPQEYFQKTFE